jgi:magnesium transporter
VAHGIFCFAFLGLPCLLFGMPRVSIRKLGQKKRHAAPGASPGTLNLGAAAGSPTIHVMSYTADRLDERDVCAVADLKPYLDKQQTVTWIDVRGLGNEATLRELAALFNIHPLALEDIVHSPQRPKTEPYEQHHFIIARMVTLRSADDMEAAQLSIFLGRNYVLTFQEELQDSLDPIRARIRRAAGLHRKLGADYLCYSILDAVVDNYFPVLEAYGEYLEELEDRTVATPARRTLHEIHTAKRELLDLRRVIWPQRDTINQLIRDESPLISKDVRVFLRDCYDHAVQVMDMVETYREITSGLHDVYLSSIANRTNEIMKVLTIISTFFIPLTFLAGLYGMNFDTNASPYSMPELRYAYGYPLLLLAMLLIACLLAVFFWRKGWLFNKEQLDSPRDDDKRDAR